MLLQNSDVVVNTIPESPWATVVGFNRYNVTVLGINRYKRVTVLGFNPHKSRDVLMLRQNSEVVVNTILESPWAIILGFNRHKRGSIATKSRFWGLIATRGSEFRGLIAIRSRFCGFIATRVKMICFWATEITSRMGHTRNGGAILW